MWPFSGGPVYPPGAGRVWPEFLSTAQGVVTTLGVAAENRPWRKQLGNKSRRPGSERGGRGVPALLWSSCGNSGSLLLRHDYSNNNSIPLLSAY